jgi:hypothetical protein
MGIRGWQLPPKAPLPGRKGGSFHHLGRSSKGVRTLPARAKRMSVVEVESAVLGNSDAVFGGGDTHVPTGYNGPYPTAAKPTRVGSGMPLIIRRERC